MNPEVLRMLKLDIAEAVHGCRHPHLAALLAWAADQGVYDQAIAVVIELLEQEPPEVDRWWRTTIANGPLNGLR